MERQYKYSLNVVWSDRDQEYVATSSEFPGLSALSEDPDDAVAELRDALAAAIDAYSEDGEPIPEPRTLEDFSGQLRLRLGKTLHASAVARAGEEGLSLNSFIQEAVAGAVAASAAYSRAAKGFNEARCQLEGSLRSAAELERAASLRLLSENKTERVVTGTSQPDSTVVVTHTTTSALIS